jgi:uncharacterized protein YhaN
VDDAVLTRFLGSTGRDRFGSLFGLDHVSLRSGGEHLLAADGDIGRLIVEAGGGLRTLVGLIDGLGQQAAQLFDTRRKSDRQFYIGVDAFEAADKAVKDGLMTREAFEQARQQRNAAQERVDALRERERGLAEEILRLGRLARVVPSIREHDRVAEELTAFAGLPEAPHDFAAGCETGLKSLETAEAALREAESRRQALQARIEAIILPTATLNAEAAIRDAGEKAVHVAKAREDRPNRDVELSQLDVKLNAVRAVVDPADNAALDLAPPAEAIASVQRLAAQGLERRGKIASLIEERAREGRTEGAIVVRQDQRRAAGAHEPFGVPGADFADLAALTAAAEAKARQVARTQAEIDAGIARLGFSGIADLTAWSCPDAAVIQSEIDRQNAITTEQVRVLDGIANESKRHETALANIDRFLTGAEPPSEAAIARVRAERDRIWDEIKARYLSPAGEHVAARSLADRVADVELKQDRTRQSDDLADRRSVEAGRVAALEQAQRQKSESAVALKALAQQQAGLAEQLSAAVAAWTKAWPAAAARAPDLGSLKMLVSERSAVLASYANWRSLAGESETQSASIVPRLAALAEAEKALGLAGEGTLVARVAAATARIRKHDDAYADYRQDEIALRGVRLKLKGIDDAHDALTQAEAAWRIQWRAAIRMLGLEDEIALERANEIATQWATAAGLLEAIRIARRRLKRMDEDEAELLATINEIRGTMEFALPDDPVAAAKMLSGRLEAAQKIRIEHDGLKLQLTERIAERDEKQRMADAARGVVDALCREGACASEELPSLAGRCRQLAALTDRLEALAETIEKLGDGLSIEDLRGQWAGRDLDAIKAELDQLRGEQVRAVDATETARAALQDRTGELRQLSAAEGINAAVAEREQATAEIHDVLERYIEIALAEELLRAAMDRVREQQKDPLIARAGALFAAATAGAFGGIETEIDGKGTPVVIGRRSTGERVPVSIMSDGARDQLFLAFRIASIEQYCRAAEPLPFIADDLLVHFDEDRGAAALRLLAELGKSTQVLVFTHHRHLLDAAAPLVTGKQAATIELAGMDGR